MTTVPTLIPVDPAGAPAIPTTTTAPACVDDPVANVADARSRLDASPQDEPDAQGTPPSAADLVERMVQLHERTRIATTPGGFERQEADGQAMVLTQDVLPQTIRGATREQLAAWGLRFGDAVDDVFVACTLPSGWTKRAGDWDTHNDVFDEQGRHRAFLFYKAVFYDRQAYLVVRPRFDIDLYQRVPGNDHHRRAVITDGGRVLHELGTWDRAHDAGTSDALYEAGERWLNERYPRWKDRVAYWTA